MTYHKLLEEIRVLDAKIQQRNLDERKKMLDKYKLYDKVQCNSSESKLTMYSKELNKMIYYKKVYHEISEDDFNLLLKKDNELYNNGSLTNRPISFSAPNVLATFYLFIGFLAGIIIMVELNIVFGISLMLSSVIFSIFFYSLGHIIKQLNLIIKNGN